MTERQQTVCDRETARIMEAVMAEHATSLQIAFVQGAKWREYHMTGATMWPEDQRWAEADAATMMRAGTLGRLNPQTESV